MSNGKSSLVFPFWICLDCPCIDLQRLVDSGLFGSSPRTVQVVSEAVGDGSRRDEVLMRINDG